MYRRTYVIVAGLLVAFGVMGGGVVGAAITRIGAWEIRFPRATRPDIIPPEIGLTIPRGNTFPVTIYEYVDQDHHIVSGRTITYSFPPAYYSGPLPRRGQSALHFAVAFDLDSGVAWSSRPEWLRLPKPGTEASVQAAGRKALITVSVISIGGPKQRDLAAAKSRGAVDIAAIPTVTVVRPREYHWIGAEYCDFEMFERSSRGNPLARQELPYPFNTAMIFAHPDGKGGYDRIIECNPVTPLGWCWTHEPHPIARDTKIYFGGSKLCKWDDVVAKATDLLRRHVTGETAAVEGWGQPYVHLEDD